MTGCYFAAYSAPLARQPLIISTRNLTEFLNTVPENEERRIEDGLSIFAVPPFCPETYRVDALTLSRLEVD